MIFLGPVYAGERLEIDATVTHVGRTSLETRIEVFAEPLDRAEPARWRRVRPLRRARPRAARTGPPAAAKPTPTAAATRPPARQAVRLARRTRHSNPGRG